MKSHFILYSFPALGTLFWIEVFEDLPINKISEISEIIKKEIQEFESNYSRFKESSLTSKLNGDRKLENPPLELLTMLSYASELYQLTGGVFSVAIGEILENYGYDSNFSFSEKEPVLFVNKPLEEIFTLEEGVLNIKDSYKLDLGGMGKGFLIDKISNLLKEKFNLKYFLINGGGDIFVTSDNENPVEIYLESPLNSDIVFGSVALKNQSLCASSPHKRKWYGEKSKKELNHIVDLLNIEKLNSSFVVGPNATICDTLATCLCVSEDCFSDVPGVTYLVLDKDGEVIKNTLE